MSRPPNIIITAGHSHVLHVERASTRRLRKLTDAAVGEACRRARERGARPITMVDDLTVHSVGPWVARFAAALARSARSEGISVVGGEMAQMRDLYAPGYAGVFVTVVSLMPK